MLLRRRVRQVHRWLGLLVSLQLLAWVSGGVVMSALDLDRVRGQDRAVPEPMVDLRRDGAAPDPARVLAQLEIPVYAMELTHWQGREVWRLRTAAGERMYAADAGQRLDPIPESMAAAVARADYAVAAAIAGVDWVTEPALEYRGRELPLWRVRFDDDRNTAIYVSPRSGEVVARRNDWWRLFDFVWMLHIMDYDQRDDFNHPLLVATAVSALAFVFSGLWMLVLALRR